MTTTPEQHVRRQNAYLDLVNYGCPEGCKYNEVLHTLDIRIACVLHKSVLED